MVKIFSTMKVPLQSPQHQPLSPHAFKFQTLNSIANSHRLTEHNKKKIQMNFMLEKTV